MLSIDLINNSNSYWHNATYTYIYFFYSFNNQINLIIVENLVKVFFFFYFLFFFFRQVLYFSYSESLRQRVIESFYLR